MTALSGVDIKLRRADTHIAQIADLIGPVVQAATQTIWRDYDGDSTKLVYYVRKVPSIDPSWAAVVGDALVNIRSAFDHLAWQLVLLDEGEPCEYTQFPIYGTRLNDKGNPRVVTIKPQIRRTDILAALDRVQPYQRYDGNLWMDQLWVVNRLCNTDKHRLLLTMASVLDFDANPPMWGLPPGVPSPSHWFNVFKPLKDGDPVARFDFKGAKAPADFDPRISLAVTLDEGPPAHWMRLQDVAGMLAGLRSILTNILNAEFVPLFGSTEPLLWAPQRWPGHG